MNQSALFHPGMLAALPGFTERITIQERIDAPDETGELQPTWVDLPDHIGLHAHVGPVDAAYLGDQPEAGRAIVIGDFNATLDGLYPLITTRHRAIWTVAGALSEPFTRGEYADPSPTVTLTCDIVRRVQTLIATTIILRQVIP